jgi:hypothetical protein
LQLNLPAEDKSEVRKCMQDACSALETATAIAAGNHAKDLDFEISLIGYQLKDLLKKIR